MLYHPEGLYVWDTWYFNYNGKLHCIHLEILRPVSKRDISYSGALGHAVTEDLIHWTELPPALFKGEAGSYDDDDLWTGCVEEKDGVLYLYYTARSSKEGGIINRIALATSTDGIHWERHPENPILIPDEKYYANEFDMIKPFGHGHPISDCRDMCVVKDGDGYVGFFAVRRHADVIADTSVIALARSKDLVHWEQEAPCFTPDRFGCVEVPEVFFLDGKYYMLCLTGNEYGNRRAFSDHFVKTGTIYAVSDKLEGPYVTDPSDNTVIGSVIHQGYSCKTALWNGQRVMFYTQGETKAGCPHGAISLPSRLITVNGKLRAVYHPVISENYIDASLGEILPYEYRFGSKGEIKKIAGGYSFTCRNDWAAIPFGESFGNFMMTFNMTIKNASAAGIVMRMGDDILKKAPIVLFDAEDGVAEFTTVRDFPSNEKRTCHVERNKSMQIRIIASGNIYMVYVEDCLLLQLFEPTPESGKIALWVEQGTAEFTDLKIYREKD